MYRGHGTPDPLRFGKLSNGRHVTNKEVNKNTSVAGRGSLLNN